MAKYAQEANITLNRCNVAAIQSSIDSINRKYGTRFTQKDTINFCKRLQHQHFVFGFVIILLHVEYNEEHNRVLADPFVWHYITLKYPIAEAYMLCAEPDWIELHFIFGNPSPADVFAESEMIQISNDPSNQRQATMNINSHCSMQASHVVGSLDLSSIF
ncbi:hypothetical protein CDL12_23379 [Handroanthus impetiginosus]|uniref:Uncharacterized protein n=1 Tax=Handroanthus impetiginosus TaxID=429701 RepID=A0A2G9GFM1_9LAMI|nr:hypothetical protein CDL12_23379 [Handroanthus impetiginosus]